MSQQITVHEVSEYDPDRIVVHVYTGTIVEGERWFSRKNDLTFVCDYYAATDSDGHVLDSHIAEIERLHPGAHLIYLDSFDASWIL
jgi:hypothetical protein